MDFSPSSPDVAACDLTRGIPLPDGCCDAVYHSHVLEHFRRDAVLPFLRECRRVLAPGGVMRVVVPDLEDACRTYLAKLEAARDGEAGADQDHEWMTVELVDQLARERSGGEMLDYLRGTPLPNTAFVRARIGEEVADILDPPPQARRAWKVRLRFAYRALRQCYEQVAGRVLFGATGSRALRIGRFRLSGEAHQWMYDAHSLSRLLQVAGFGAPILQSAQSSLIPRWADFLLDVTADGKPVRPNSLYMEAVKE